MLFLAHFFIKLMEGTDKKITKSKIN